MARRAGVAAGVAALSVGGAVRRGVFTAGGTALGVEAWVRHQFNASRAAIALAARPLSIDPAASAAAPVVVLPAPVETVATNALSRAEPPSRPAPRVDYDLDRGTPMGDTGDLKASY